MRSDFYVYVLLDPRKPGTYEYESYGFEPYDYDSIEFKHEPFYIGKGHGNRAYTHLRDGNIRAYAKHVKNPYKINKIRKIKQEGFMPIVHILEPNLTEPQAFDLERACIKAIGRKDHGGPLTNATDGGEGVSGFVWTADQKARIGNRFKAWHASLTPEEKAKWRRNKHIGLVEALKRQTDEQRKAHAAAISEASKKRTPEERAAIAEKFSEIQRNLPPDVDKLRRKRLSRAAIAVRQKASPEWRAEHAKKSGAGIKRAWENHTEAERQARIAAASNWHYDKPQKELKAINNKIANTVAEHHANMSDFDYRMRCFMVMCGNMMKNAGKQVDDLKEFLRSKGIKFYLEPGNLSVDPKEKREKVRTIIEAWPFA